MFVAGECFVRLRPRRAEDGLLVPLQMQLLQSTDETALAVLARVSVVADKLKRGDFAN
jgi:hypothetical protein